MTTDGSIAVWAAHKPDRADAKVEVHFNYWRIAADANFKPVGNFPKRDFIEIGVLLKNAAGVASVNIFVPGASWSLEDCGPRFASPEIAQAIFNIQLRATVSAPPGPTYVDLVHPNDTHFCRVHKFRVNNNGIDQAHLNAEVIAGGTLLTITPAALNEVCAGIDTTPAYFRLRAYWNPEDTSPFVEKIKPTDKAFQSGYTEIQYLDFRLNEARTLPTAVENLMRNDVERIVPQTMAAFLTAVPVQLSVTASSAEEHKMRLLEYGLWKSYVPGEIPTGMVVYHWKTEGDAIQDFSAFVKMETRVSSGKVLIVYLVVAFLFAILSNLSASAIYDYTKGLLAKPDASISSTAKSDSTPSPSNSNATGNPTSAPAAKQDMRQK